MNTKLIIALAVSNCTLLCAQQSVDNDSVKKTQILKEVIILPYNPNPQVNLGKAGIHAMDLPQSSAVIDQETLQDQQVNSISDLLKNTNGVYIMGTTGGYQEEIASRGNSMSSSNTFKNGVRYFNGMSVEMSGIEKAEILKGSVAILYGNVSAGGVLNLITKKPRFDFGGEVAFRTGSFALYKPTFDVYGAATKNLAYRVNAAYENAESFRNEVRSQRYYFNPSLLFKLGKNTGLTIEGDFLKDRRTPDFGAGIVNYEIVDLPRERFLGVSWGYFDAEQTSLTATLDHRLSRSWTLTSVTGLRQYQTELFSNSRPNTSGGTVSTDGNWNRNLQKSEANDRYFLQELDLKGELRTGKIRHQLLTGADWESYKTVNISYNPLSAANNNGQAFYDTVNIYEPYDPSSEPAIPSLSRNTRTVTPVNRFGVYAQDLVHFSSHVKLLAGLRYTYQDTESQVFRFADGTQNPATNNFDEAFSPRLGLILSPTDNHSFFASYANSFQTNTGVDVNGRSLDPSIIDQFELGVKNEFLNKKLSANITVYQITNSNLAQISLANGNTDSSIKELAGETRSQGVELDFVAVPMKGLRLMAGYSFNETKYVKSNTYIEGSELRYNPKNTANLSVHYDISQGVCKGLGFGVVTTYFGQRYAGRSTRLTVENDSFRLIPLDDFFQMDATASYTYKKVRINAKLSNVFNELNYFIHDDNSLNPIAPRAVSVGISYLL